MSSSTCSSSSSISMPTSLLSKPSSLFGSSVSTNSLAPKKDQGQNPKQKPIAGKKKKSKTKPQGYNYTMIAVPGDTDTASSEVFPSPSNLQSKRKTFKFSGGDNEQAVTTLTKAYQPDDLSETSSPGSPQNLSDFDFNKVKFEKVNLHAEPIGNIFIQNDRDDQQSEGYETTEDERSIGDDSAHGDSLESVIKRGLFQLPCTHGLVDTFKAGVRSNILRKLRGMLNKEPTHEVVLELADSIDLLRLLGASDPTLDAIGKNMQEGVILYENGMAKVNEGQDLFRSALSEISSLK